MTTSTRRSLTNEAVMDAASDAYALKAEIVRREAECNQPVPVITMTVLIVFALAVFAVNLAVFGKGAW